MDPLVVVFGLGVGLLIGTTGIGGGSLMTPLLILVVGVQPVVAVGTDLAYGAITKSVGAWRHLRRGSADLAVCLYLAIGSVPGSLLGVWIVTRLHRAYGESFDTILLACVAAALLVAAVAVLVRALFMPGSAARERSRVEMTPRMRATSIALGLVLGLILGLTSVGSGALIGLVLILVFRLTPHRVVSTDVVHAAVLLWVAGAAHLVSGHVDLGLMANILVGSVPGVWIGTRLLPSVPAAGLRPALGCIMLGSALGVLSKAGVDVPVAAIVGAPLLVGLYAWHRQRRRRRHEAPAEVGARTPVAPRAGGGGSSAGHTANPEQA